MLTLYPIEELVADTNAGDASSGTGLRGVTLAINVDERDEVDQAIEAVRRAGARVTKEPVDAEWGGRRPISLIRRTTTGKLPGCRDSNMAQAIRRASNLE